MQTLTLQSEFLTQAKKEKINQGITYSQKSVLSFLGRLGRCLISSISFVSLSRQRKAWSGMQIGLVHSLPVIWASQVIVLLIDSSIGPLHVRLLLLMQLAVVFHALKVHKYCT